MSQVRWAADLSCRNANSFSPGERSVDAQGKGYSHASPDWIRVSASRHADTLQGPLSFASDALHRLFNEMVDNRPHGLFPAGSFVQRRLVRAHLAVGTGSAGQN